MLKIYTRKNCAECAATKLYLKTKGLPLKRFRSIKIQNSILILKMRERSVHQLWNLRWVIG